VEDVVSTPREQREQHRQALALAWGSLSGSQRRKVSVVEYYCRVRSCPLLTVFQVPGGLLSVALPRYRKSPQRNAAGSTASARVRRTVDGDRRWRARVVRLEEFADPLLPQLGVEVKLRPRLEAGLRGGAVGPRAAGPPRLPLRPSLVAAILYST
jgi:hypothetical protein